MYREVPKEDKVEKKKKRSSDFFGMFKCVFGKHDFKVMEIMAAHRLNGKTLRVFDPDLIWCERCAANDLKKDLNYTQVWRITRPYDEKVVEIDGRKEFWMLSYYASFSTFDGSDGDDSNLGFGYGSTAYTDKPIDNSVFLDEFLEGINEECRNNPAQRAHLLSACHKRKF